MVCGNMLASEEEILHLANALSNISSSLAKKFPSTLYYRILLVAIQNILY